MKQIYISDQIKNVNEQISYLKSEKNGASLEVELGKSKPIT